MTCRALSAIALLLALPAVGLRSKSSGLSVFKEEQLRCERVRSAVHEKEEYLKSLFARIGLAYPPRQIFIRAFKEEKVLGDPLSPGGDIFIHGSCLTIGCLPLTDDKIKEVYLAAVEARAAGQAQIPVHIFPARLTEANLSRLRNMLRNGRPPVSLPLKDSRPRGGPSSLLAQTERRL